MVKSSHVCVVEMFPPLRCQGTHAAASDSFHGVNSDRWVLVSVDSVALGCCWVLRVVCQLLGVLGVSPTGG